MFSVYTTLGEFENGAFTLNVHASNVFRPHYAVRICKRSFHSKRTRIKYFPSTLRRRNLKTELSL